MIVKELFARLGLDADALSFAKGELLVKGVEKGLAAFYDAAVAAAEGLKEFIVGNAEAISDIGRSAAAAGMSASAFQKFAYAASSAGLDMEKTKGMLSDFSTKILDAKTNGGDLALIFQKMKVKLGDLHGKTRPVLDIMDDLADKFQKMPDSVNKAAYANKLFGGGNVAILDLLNKGSAGIKAYGDELEDLGGVLSDQAIANSREFSGTLKRAQTIVTALSQTIAADLMPQATEIVKAFIAWVKQNKELIKTKITQFVMILKSVMSAFLKVVLGLANAGLWLVDNWKLIAFILGTIVLTAIYANIGAIVTWLGWVLLIGNASIASALSTAAAWAVANAEILATGAVIALLVLFFEDLYQFLTGGESLIGELGPMWTKFLDDLLKPNDEDPWWLETIKRFFRILFDLQGEIPKLIDDWAKIFSDLGNWIAGIFNGIADSIKNAISGAIDWVKGKLQAVGSFIMDSPLGWLIKKDMQMVGAIGDGLKGAWNAVTGGSSNPDAGANVASGITNPASAFGGGANPAASAAAGVGIKPPTVNAPVFKGEFNITTGPGQNPEDTAGQTRDVINNWWETKNREAFAAVGG